ncbi:hypothetical protein M758_11G151800 [Ceratodon purpureus]|uniref:Uncharacterized protein n=1 Tax=Ceratodon purpureus TaxID=3225 RepID=A0A8T0GGL3_CERPU|nr:hypothetical protein KC19_11G155700 [Ceratodon purpureus]KAG0601969.1 hypothetical protein M758_11G151800 [Ceratodon purpureus]
MSFSLLGARRAFLLRNLLCDGAWHFRLSTIISRALSLLRFTDRGIHYQGCCVSPLFRLVVQ